MARLGGGRILSEIVLLSNKLANTLVERGQPLTQAQTATKFISLGKVPEMQDLIALVSKLTANDLRLSLPDEEAWKAGDYSQVGHHPAPCIYTGIYEPESALLSMSLFSLRDGDSRLPLHDHPGMHGIIKVVRGRIRIFRYSWLDPVVERQLVVPASLSSLRKKIGVLRPAKYEGCSLLSPEDNACLLEPMNGNVHSIEAVDGSATFFDLLLPSYSPPGRDCHYYEVAQDEEEQSAKNITWLRRTGIPSTYYCDSLPFKDALI
uniref:2-aminoethanethiol dioxygenase n=1 Tax=Plectus sambesii TaxID=2011161 RepID=A0A914VEJ7_9BILA